MKNKSVEAFERRVTEGKLCGQLCSLDCNRCLGHYCDPVKLQQECTVHLMSVTVLFMPPLIICSVCCLSNNIKSEVRLDSILPPTEGLAD